MNRFRYFMFPVTVFLVLALSAVSTVPALADDEPPPPAESSEAVPPPEEAPPQEATPAEEPIPVEETQPVEEAPAEEPAAVEAAPAPEEPSVPQEGSAAEVLAQLPEGTDLMVVDAEGEILSLATLEAEDAIYTGDPRWCPVGVSPSIGTGCTPVRTSFQDMLDDLAAINSGGGPSVAGVIWVEMGYDSSEIIADPSSTGLILDGLSLINMANFALTINGGWTGTGTALNPKDLSEFNVPLSILNWNNTVTINNILITGAPASADGTYALEVTSSMNVTLTNVDVVDNTTEDGGAYVDNTAGTGNVVINDSTFNGNAGNGLEVYSNGTITGKNLSAIGNGGAGAWLDNSTAPMLLPKAVTLTGTNNFKFNGGDGLYILSRGAITLNNVTAIYNSGGSGAELDNCGGYNIVTGKCNQSSLVSILGASNNFSNNGWDGLRVWSGGAITLANITASNNGTDGGRPGETMGNDAYGKGAYLNNRDAALAKTITLTGTNTFNDNASAGLFAYGFGMISVNNLTASGNAKAPDCNPLKEAVDMCDGAILDGSGVLLTGYGGFEDNYNDGLAAYSGRSVYSTAAVILYNLYAEGNGAWGVSLDSVGPISLFGANVFNSNLGGLNVLGEGAVTLYNVTARYNSTNGVYVDNALKWNPLLLAYVMAGAPVNLAGANTFSLNTDYGLEVHSSGIITTSNVTAQDNGDGVYLDNCLYVTSACTGLPGRAVTMNGVNDISFNFGDGLYIDSLGAITVRSLTAGYNSGSGAILDNLWTGALGGVTITGYANTSLNVVSGLEIYSRGAVLAYYLTANQNGPGSTMPDTWYDGVFINNAADPLKLINVTLVGLNQFNDNWNSGLEVHSYGIITTTSVTALGNGDGVYLDNCLYVTSACTGLPGRAVTMNGVNNISLNLGGGLYITSRGAITVRSLTASDNGGSGAILDNDWTGALGGVTITGYANTSLNGVSGLEIYSRGAVLTYYLTANDNGPASSGLGETWYDGVVIYNAADPLKLMSVTLLGVNQFNDNWNSGLEITSNGSVVLYNVTANGNGNGGLDDQAPEGYGVVVDNAGVVRPVTLYGTNILNDNLDYGLWVDSQGAILVYNITASWNDGGGAYLDNQLGIVNSPLTIAGYGVFSNNQGGTGLEAYSHGTITIYSLTANYNASGGVYLDNWSMTLVPVNVTLYGLNNFNGNTAGDGLMIYTDGQITLYNITANDNDGKGIYLNNVDYQIIPPLPAIPVVRNIYLYGTNTFVNNAFNGMGFDATGLVALTRIIADMNDRNTDASDYSGVVGTAGGSITLTCGSMNLNEGAGYDLTGTAIYLTGVFTYGNGLANYTSVLPSITRTCSLP